MDRKTADRTRLEDGDVIDLGVSAGKHMYAKVDNKTVTIEHCGQVTGSMAVSAVPQAMLDAMLRAKAAWIDMPSSSTGSPRC